MIADGAARLDRDAEEALIPISALQHYLFCPRQCALIHIERIWTEDVATAEGRILHERAHAGHAETRPGVRIARGIALRSFELGVTGIADVVEFHGSDRERPRRPFPIEYKRGKPKAHRADEVQLCAQALCLEETFQTTIPDGAVFYGITRRRQNVVFDADLRALTAKVAKDARAMLSSAVTPPPIKMPACQRCSLRADCRPERLERPPSTLLWLTDQLRA